MHNGNAANGERYKSVRHAFALPIAIIRRSNAFVNCQCITVINNANGTLFSIKTCHYKMSCHLWLSNGLSILVRLCESLDYFLFAAQITNAHANVQRWQMHSHSQWHTFNNQSQVFIVCHYAGFSLQLVESHTFRLEFKLCSNARLQLEIFYGRLHTLCSPCTTSHSQSDWQWKINSKKKKQHRSRTHITAWNPWVRLWLCEINSTSKHSAFLFSSEIDCSLAVCMRLSFVCVCVFSLNFSISFVFVE